MATSSALGLTELSFRFEKKVMKCRLRTKEGYVAFSYVAKGESDINVDDLYKVTLDAGDVSSILKMSKEQEKVGFNIIDGRATVVAGNSKKKIPVLEHEIWMDRFPNPEITQVFTMTYDQIRGIISSFDVKESSESARVTFNPEGVTFMSFDNQRQTECVFKKEDFGRASLTKIGKATFFAQGMMQIMSMIPKGANVEVAVDTNMPLSITFDVEAGRFKILQAPFIEED